MNDPTAARRLLRNAYRELTVCVIVWLVAMVWTLGVYLLLGYRHSADHWLVTSGWARHPETPIGTVYGMPDWVFHGIFVPWASISLFTVVYVLWWMADDDLGADKESGDELV